MQCRVCGTENDEFAITCVKCRGFLQNRVPNLDLFETIWHVIERPQFAFRRITLADHKNYSSALFGLFGIGAIFAVLSIFRLGDRFESLLTLIIWGIVAGIVSGLVLWPFVTGVHWLLAKIAGGKSGFRVSMGISAYALTPILVSVVLVLPIELLTFGMYLFTHNPHPVIIKPEIYYILIGFDTIAVLWSVALLTVGTAVGHQLRIVRAGIVAVFSSAIVCGALFQAGRSLSEIWHP